MLSVEGYCNPADIDIARVGVQSALLGLVGNNNVVLGQLVQSRLAPGVNVTLDIQRVQCIGDIFAILGLLLIGLVVVLLALGGLAGLALGLLLLFALLLGKSLLLFLA